MSLYAVMACHRPDVEKAKTAISGLGLSSEHIIVVANGENPPEDGELDATVVQFPRLEHNVARWWNFGLDFVWMNDPHAVVFLTNADTYIEKPGLMTLKSYLNLYNLSMVSPDYHQTLEKGEILVRKHTRPGPAHQLQRMAGFALMFRVSELRADAQFRHWYVDDDLEWQARAATGTGLVGGVPVSHPSGGNPLTSEQRLWADEDRERFRVKWGNYPWE